MRSLFLVFIFSFLSFGNISVGKKPADIMIHWEDSFTTDEKSKVKSWLVTVFSATKSTLGKYPFKTHLYIHRSKNKNEPVPWANTSRGKNQSVHFHINPDFTLDDFLKDWTAPHEISHLSIPFVGKENSWFSEGYASYMQYQIMKTQGIYPHEEVEEKYWKRFLKCKPSYQTTLPFPEAAINLKKEWNYPDMYWGGATFFWKLNNLYLDEIGLSLTQVVIKYEGCCRVNNSTPEELVLVWDAVTETKLASQLLESYKTQPASVQFENFK